MNVKRPLQRRVLYEETVDVDFAADTVDLEQLRRAFARPFDRAAHAVQTAGYEQDDAVIERYLICCIGSDNPLKVPAVSLADPERFLHHLLDIATSTNHASNRPAGIRIVGLRVEALLETWT